MADEAYLRESILEPQAKIVAGFEPVMPTFKGRLKDKEITAIIEYIKSLDNHGPGGGPKYYKPMPPPKPDAARTAKAR